VRTMRMPALLVFALLPVRSLVDHAHHCEKVVRP
jgi:hypothetical protein